MSRASPGCLSRRVLAIIKLSNFKFLPIARCQRAGNGQSALNCPCCAPRRPSNCPRNPRSPGLLVTFFPQLSASTAPEAAPKKPAHQILVPEVRLVPTYQRDYLPLFSYPPTYLRGRGTLCVC